jgi:two-component system CheB/CheR fusion protein
MSGDRPETDQSPCVPTRWWLRLGHDLRAPIAPMRMALQLLRSGQANPRDQQEALRVLERQFEQLLANIDDISNLARMSAGLFSSEMPPADLNLVLDVVNGKTALARCLEEKQQTLRCVPSESAVTAEHDTRRLAELVEYLVGKYARQSPTGAELTLLLDQVSDPPRARLRIVGAGGSPLEDVEFAYVAGFSAIDPAELEAKPIVMREIARLHRIVFPPDEQESGVTLTLPGHA